MPITATSPTAITKSAAGAASPSFSRLASSWVRVAKVLKLKGRKSSVEYLRKTHYDNVPMKPHRVYSA